MQFVAEYLNEANQVRPISKQTNIAIQVQENEPHVCRYPAIG